MIERECPVCGKPFKVWPSRVKHGRGVHCSKECQYIANREKLSGPKIALTCIGCGVDFERAPSWLTRKGAGKYCSRECRDINWIGDKNPNWQNGDNVYKRGSRWHSIRRRILKRDKVCQCCGDEGTLDVHHIIPFRVFVDKDAANDDDNLVALCKPCHRRTDAMHKWAVIPCGGAIMMNAGGAAWQMAREKGLI